MWIERGRQAHLGTAPTEQHGEGSWRRRPARSFRRRLQQDVARDPSLGIAPGLMPGDQHSTDRRSATIAARPVTACRVVETVT